VAERDALRQELAEARELADADMKALGEDSDRYIAELLAEHEAERERVQEQVRALEAQVEALQGKVDDHAIERYELVQQRDAAQRAAEEGQAGAAPADSQAPGESAAVGELAAELAEVREVVTQLTAERDELLLALESTKADSVVEQDRLVTELVESHHEEVASLSGELDSVTAAALETEQQLDAVRAEVEALEDQVAILSQPPADDEPGQPDIGAYERRAREAEAELQRVLGENAVLHQMVEEARGGGADPLLESEPLAAGAPPDSHERAVQQAAEIELQAPSAAERETLRSADEADAPVLAVEEWGSEAPRADGGYGDEGYGSAEPAAASHPVDRAIDVHPGAGQGAGAVWEHQVPSGALDPGMGQDAPAWEPEVPSGGAPGPGMGQDSPAWEPEVAGGGAPDPGFGQDAPAWEPEVPSGGTAGPGTGQDGAAWELDVPSGGAPDPGATPAVPDWDLDTPRMSSEVTTEPPSSGDGPSIPMADPSDPAPDHVTPPPDAEPAQWELADSEPAVTPEVAAQSPAVDLRDQTPTVPPRRAAREQQDAVPSGGDESDGTYSYVAPRTRRKKRPR